MLPQTKPQGLGATDSKSIPCKHHHFKPLEGPALKISVPLHARMGNLKIFRLAKQNLYQ